MADPKKYNPEEVEKAMALLERTKKTQAKQREKLKNDPKAKEQAAASALKRRVSDSILKRKALAAGITVTPAELDAEVKKLSVTPAVK